jgi:transcription factor SFP1
MKDFSCCGLTLPTLHDLLQHYEEAHAQKDPVGADQVPPAAPDTRAALAANTANQVQQEAQQRNMQGQHFNLPTQVGIAAMPQRSALSNTLQTVPDMDTVEDMEMDLDDGNDNTPPSNLYTRSSATTSPQVPFASMQPQIPQLNTTMMQGHQQYRQSAPSTPVATSRGPTFNNAPLSANPMQQFQDLNNPYRHTPDSSAPGTPGELDESLMLGMDDMSMQNPLFSNDAFGTNFGYGMNNDMIDLCIDEPAKRLFQQNNRGAGQANGNSVHSRLGSGQYGANSDIARTIRERQAAAGLPDTTTNIAPHEEPKPFRCPVIGCEKAYKNQNGLKYHKSVSDSVTRPRSQANFNSMATTIRDCTRMAMAPSPSSTLTLKRLTPAHKAWRRRSPTSVMCVRRDTRT